MALLKFFKYDFLVTAVALTVALLYGGGAGLTTAAILIVLEIVFSFDNAGVNAKYLEKLSPAWRKIFLTVGMIIAVLGMRLLFPFAIVCIFGKIGPIEAWNLAMDKGDPHVEGTYGYILQHAHPMIASFGGMFLLMLFLNFIFDEEKDAHWLSWIEKPLAKAGHFDSMAILVAGLSLLGATTLLTPEHERYSVLACGVAGILTYVATNGLATFMEDRQEGKEESLAHTAMLTGQAAFSTFLFLEVLDASFSFDGVLGAFAITTDPIIIALGLGVGALFVRSMTIYLVEKGTLSEYEFLEHGAHWAIGILATMLLLTIKFDIPDAAIGLTGLVFIAASLISSKRRGSSEEDDEETAEDPYDSHGIYNRS